MTKFIFQKTLIIGVGLIGSSLARALREHGISSEIYGVDISDDVLAKCNNLNILLNGKKDLKDYSCQFDLIIICSPLSTYKKIFASLNYFVKEYNFSNDSSSIHDVILFQCFIKTFLGSSFFTQAVNKRPAASAAQIKSFLFAIAKTTY